MNLPFLVAIVYVGLHDKNNALEWLLKTAQSSKELNKTGLYGLDDTIYDWLRDDARFDEIRQAANDAPTNARS